jgi:hypothetical protein
MGYYSGCAQVNGDSEVSFAVVARFNFDDLGSLTSPAYGYRDLVLTAL